jgi:hypothetical protein
MTRVKWLGLYILFFIFFVHSVFHPFFLLVCSPLVQNVAPFCLLDYSSNATRSLY